MLLLWVILATPDLSRLLKACECVPWYRLRPNECWNRCCHIWWNNCKQPTLNIYWLLKELGKVAGHQTCYHLVSSSNILENFDTRQLWEKYWHLKILLVPGKTLTHFFLSDHIFSGEYQANFWKSYFSACFTPLKGQKTKTAGRLLFMGL